MDTVSTIKVTKTETSRLSQVKLENLSFGKVFTDHMLVADYADGAWQSVEIIPYQKLSFEPSLAAIHYGQSIFEGIKAYLNVRGEAVIFRPYENFARFNESALRMQMPEVPEEIFIDGMKELINLDKEWIPTMENHSLYIRPFMFATDTFIGVRPSATYKFIILLSPTGPYYAKPSRIAVEEKYTRAAPGGVGRAKNAGNYAASLKPAEDARLRGYDQVLWTDAFEHKWLQEVGTMNVFFVLKDAVVTPSLEEGTILDGVTRRSAVTVLKEMGLNVEERRINIDELVDAYKKGDLIEAFGTGTAATIAPIKELAYKDEHLEFDLAKNQVSSELGKRLSDIRSGVAEDTHGWIVKI
ncbi:branched-chain amino acid aminotransferase [Arachidicoccus ginsenosidimutans]|uniref:branched-chain amino acid aminotransferase n=1 Tax=Arachidicoccus sp. BS20 TaxID=1850526 RepID=UPI0007F0E8A7|nr:branched-chain amino acid aminotransferase [Arachidicoccus sp. BS20]ANI89025.1 branched-chain amino acid aminotransferase [Arachidicoccus sp. BS20]